LTGVARFFDTIGQPVTRPAALVLLDQEPIAHQCLKNTRDVLGVLGRDLLQASVGQAPAAP